MSVRIAHIADTHLGAGGFGNKLSESGINRREEDVCNAFSYCIDRILEMKPDLVIHAGDLFHTVRPSNRIINFAIREILKLSRAEIPVVIISGNHDAPRQRSVGHVLSIFENLPGVYPVFRSKFESLRFGPVALGCLPHCLTTDILHQEIEKAHPGDAEVNILIAHGVVSGIEQFSMAELSEEEIPSSVFERGFDYVALGHYHRYTQVDDNVYYAGSTERLSFGELGEKKGFLEVVLPEREVMFHRIPAREMIELEKIDSAGLDYDQLKQVVESRFDDVDLKDKIVRLKIYNLPEVLYRNLPVKDIRQKSSEAFYFKLVTEREEVEQYELAKDVKFSHVLDEFRSYLSSRPVEKLDKDRLLEMAQKYFSEQEN